MTFALIILQFQKMRKKIYKKNMPEVTDEYFNEERFMVSIAESILDS